LLYDRTISSQFLLQEIGYTKTIVEYVKEAKN
jgi:hypothetical protein